jgi:hypothetical protein
MAINYEDERFKAVEAEKNQQISQTTNTYNEMIDKSEGYYQQQIDATKQWGDKQAEIQQANTDFAIEKVNQAKEQAEKDYTREQKGAYTDYQKATNQYGVNAEQQATQGLQNSGYSESTRTNMYNTYQNRYMAARESYNKAILNYDNSIKEAQLANNAALATLAYETLQKQLELSLQGFQYKNTLVLKKTQAINEMNDRYYSRWQNVQQQINTENALAEQIRQYNESMAFQREQAAISNARAARSSGGGSGGSGDSVEFVDSQGLQDSSTGGAVEAGAKAFSKVANNEGLGSKYKSVSSTASTLYNGTKLVSKSKAKASVESFLASALANNSITKTGAAEILKKLGL